jgi:hypothetical protein
MIPRCRPTMLGFSSRPPRGALLPVCAVLWRLGAQPRCRRPQRPRLAGAWLVSLSCQAQKSPSRTIAYRLIGGVQCGRVEWLAE